MKNLTSLRQKTEERIKRYGSNEREIFLLFISWHNVVYHFNISSTRRYSDRKVVRRSGHSVTNRLPYMSALLYYAVLL